MPQRHLELWDRTQTQGPGTGSEKGPRLLLGKTRDTGSDDERKGGIAQGCRAAGSQDAAAAE